MQEGSLREQATENASAKHKAWRSKRLRMGVRSMKPEGARRPRMQMWSDQKCEREARGREATQQLRRASPFCISKRFRAFWVDWDTLLMCVSKANKMWAQSAKLEGAKWPRKRAQSDRLYNETRMRSTKSKLECEWEARGSAAIENVGAKHKARGSEVKKSECKAQSQREQGVQECECEAQSPSEQSDWKCEGKAQAR